MATWLVSLKAVEWPVFWLLMGALIVLLVICRVLEDGCRRHPIAEYWGKE